METEMKIIKLKKQKDIKQTKINMVSQSNTKLQ